MYAKLALKLLTPIPESDFITGQLTNGVDKCCATGHLIRLLQGDPTDYSSQTISTNKHVTGVICHEVGEYTRISKNTDIAITTLVRVNDGWPFTGYDQPTPKARVIQLLKDMVKAGY